MPIHWDNTFFFATPLQYIIMFPSMHEMLSPVGENFFLPLDEHHETTKDNYAVCK